LVTFNEDAERLAKIMVPTHVLKFQNLTWKPFEKRFKGSCTTDLEYRADKDASVSLGDAIGDVPATASVSTPLPTEISPKIPT